MREVATVLNLAESTVAYHKHRIMETLGSKKNKDLVRFAIRAGLVPT